MVSSSTYFVEKHLIISEGSDPVRQAVQEDERLQGDLTETSEQARPQLRIITVSVSVSVFSLNIDKVLLLTKLNHSPTH